jgi:RimJ/RimL family protein N-acetyltransferase
LQPLDDAAETEIGWWLARAWWGQGLATEAARVALTDGFERAGLNRIVAVALAANRPSIHVMEKLGMKYEREMIHRGFEVVVYAVNRLGQ